MFVLCFVALFIAMLSRTYRHRKNRKGTNAIEKDKEKESGWPTCFVFLRFRVQIPGRRPVVMIGSS
jgi:hypothetical protein